MIKRDDIFPFEYISTGYFRRKGVPVGEKAEMLHGMQVVDYLLEKVNTRRTYIIGYLIKDKPLDSMNKRVFFDEQEAREWAKNQPLPPHASSWWIECFDENGEPSWTQGISSE